MKFVQFLHSQDKKKLAKKLSCSLGMVYMWERRVSFPRRPLAKKIINISKNKIDYNDIYEVNPIEKILREDMKKLKQKLRNA